MGQKNLVKLKAVLPDSSRTVVATLAPQQLSFVFGGMSYTQSKRPSLIAADAVLCLPCEKTAAAAAVMHTDQKIHILSKIKLGM